MIVVGVVVVVIVVVEDTDVRVMVDRDEVCLLEEVQEEEVV